MSIAVSLDSCAALRCLRLQGHAGELPRGENLACAAVSVLVRTVARLIDSQAGWTVNGSAPDSGKLFLNIDNRPGDTDEWLRGVTDTLLWALADMTEEYPDVMTVNIVENEHGS